ncbi:MAG: ubiquitin carboxyl-terminal hydrolase [Oscillospiraceae bacterium]|jgi:uncharacterized UBP type Zn finger protein|nr:ubiquitin carboxyl-terminal hydrolase [Oscillospiraceae bacterium]
MSFWEKKFLSFLFVIGSIFSFEYSNLSQAQKTKELIERNLFLARLNNSARKIKIDSFKKENIRKEEQKKSITSICKLFLKKHKLILGGAAVSIFLALMLKFKNKKPTSNSNKTIVSKDYFKILDNLEPPESFELLSSKVPGILVKEAFCNSSTSNASKKILEPQIFQNPVSNFSQGLPNFGQICYLNASLQMLFHISEFRNFVIRYQGNNTFMLYELKNIFDRLLRNEKVKIEEMENFYKLISKCIGLPNIGKQEDAIEFLSNFIELIEEGIPEISSIYNVNYLQYTKFPDTSFEQIIFHDILKFIPLNIFEKTKISECIRDWFAEIETCEISNGNRVITHVKNYIESLNKYVFFQMCRLGINNNTPTKFFNSFNVIEKIIDLGDYFKNKINMKYKFIGAICHVGDSALCGHYVYIKILDDGSGIQYNDSKVKKINPDEIQKFINGSYVLLFEKI